MAPKKKESSAAKKAATAKKERMLSAAAEGFDPIAAAKKGAEVWEKLSGHPTLNITTEMKLKDVFASDDAFAQFAKLLNTKLFSTMKPPLTVAEIKKAGAFGALAGLIVSRL